MTPLLIILAAAGQPDPCGSMQDITQRLATEYHEKSVAMGVGQDGKLFGLFASEAGTWTVVKALPQGRACIVDAGSGFNLVPQGDPA